MNFSTLKKLAITSAVALTMFTGAEAFAQSTETVTINSTFSTAAGVDLTAGLALDFGTWLAIVGGGDTLTIEVDAETGAPTTTPGGASSASTLAQVTAPAQAGTVTVTTPVNQDVQIFGDVGTDFGGGVSLGSLTYSTAVVTETALPTVLTPANVIGGTAAGTTVFIGGTLSITATPAFGATLGPATIDITGTL